MLLVLVGGDAFLHTKKRLPRNQFQQVVLQKGGSFLKHVLTDHLLQGAILCYK